MVLSRRYLGVILSEHLDYDIMTKYVVQCASRALGLLIAKCKTIGGVPYDVFTKLYDSVVWPVISYSAPIWGFRSFSCIGAVHNRAMRFYLDVGKYTPGCPETYIYAPMEKCMFVLGKTF